MRQGAITVHDVGKRYRAQGGARSTTLKGYLLSGRSVVQSKSFWGLRHISFAVAPGQAVGVVGLNGAGKSTLLRLIGGVGRPDEGQIKVMGRIGALLDIGAGLTDDLTGRENIFLLGVIAGMRRTEVAERFDEIVAFAELEAAVENPVRSYSTGMRMRLAFAVAVHVRPDILLIDEALAVGDQAFQQKCIARVKEILNDGATIFFVSHDVSQVREICDHVLFLRGGRVVGYGPIDEMLPLYTSAVEAKVASVQHEPFAATKLPVELVPQVSRFGNGELQITAVELLNEQSTPTSTIVAGDRLSISLTYVGATRDRNAVIVIGVYAADDTCCFETDSKLAEFAPLVDSDTVRIETTLNRIDLAPGDYRVTVGLFSADWQQVYDYHAEVYPLAVTGPGPRKGMLNPPTQWQQVQSRPTATSPDHGSLGPHSLDRNS